MQFNTPALLEAFFERSQDGFFFMMLDEPIEWGPGVDKDAVLDYVFVHQRMTKGWKPLGGVSCYYNSRNESVRYVQAMVREPAAAGTAPNGEV